MFCSPKLISGYVAAAHRYTVFNSYDCFCFCGGSRVGWPLGPSLTSPITTRTKHVASHHGDLCGSTRCRQLAGILGVGDDEVGRTSFQQ